MGGYPKRVGRSPLGKYGVTLAVVELLLLALLFALAFAVAWYKPYLIVALLMPPLATLAIDRKKGRDRFRSLVLQYAIIAAGAFAAWIIK